MTFTIDTRRPADRSDVVEWPPCRVIFGRSGEKPSTIQSIVQRHGGSVHCEARPGGGASFVIALPRLPAG